MLCMFSVANFDYFYWAKWVNGANLKNLGYKMLLKMKLSKFLKSSIFAWQIVGVGNTVYFGKSDALSS